MKTTIVCGMLGAGKTTFIRNILSGAKEKTVVLVNDFGSTGIDGEIFSSDGIESVELPSGCICCTLKFDLITSIEKIRKNFMPEHLVIEPSGIASPSGVLDALETLKISPVIVTGIVDATEFLELNHEDAFGRFFQDQIGNSDIVLVNKADLVEGDVLRQTIEDVEKMNHSAIVMSAVNGITESPLPSTESSKKNTVRQTAHLKFETVTFRPGNELDHEEFSEFFQQMSTGRYGDIVRAKALVNTLQGPYKFDLSFTNIMCVPFEKPVNGNRLVIIGTGIKRQELSLLFPSPIAFL